jgi:hypothetical protein
MPNIDAVCSCSFFPHTAAVWMYVRIRWLLYFVSRGLYICLKTIPHPPWRWYFPQDRDTQNFMFTRHFWLYFCPLLHFFKPYYLLYPLYSLFSVLVNHIVRVFFLFTLSIFSPLLTSNDKPLPPGDFQYIRVHPCLPLFLFSREVLRFQNYSPISRHSLNLVQGEAYIASTGSAQFF